MVTNIAIDHREVEEDRTARSGALRPAEPAEQRGVRRASLGGPMGRVERRVARVRSAWLVVS